MIGDGGRIMKEYSRAGLKVVAAEIAHSWSSRGVIKKRQLSKNKKTH